MRLFIDGEWNGYRGELISMALVAEDGREFYAVLGCANPEPWVAEHVMPKLGVPPGFLQESAESVQVRLALFLAQFDAAHIVADWPEDIERFCRLLITGPGTRIDTPPLTIEIVRVDAPSKNPHNALADARGLRDSLAIARAADYLRAQADAQPVAWVDVADSYEGPYIFHGKEPLPAGRHDLYTLPAPAAPQAGPKREPRPCTCHPDDNPPVPCAQKYALNECRATRSGPGEAQIEARDALLDFISENGTASEGVQHYLDRYVRAALAQIEQEKANGSR